jgi:26S proteasome regulatory subunit N2
MEINLQSGEFLISMLHSETQSVAAFALDGILNSVHYLWIDFVDHIGTIKRVIDHFPQLKKKAAFCLSQIFFYADNLTEALQWVVLADELFDIKLRSLYTDSMISMVINKYINHLNSKPKSDEEEDLNEKANQSILVNKYENIITNILESSYSLTMNIDRKIIIGLAIETNKTIFISKVISNLSNEDLSRNFEFAVNLSETKKNSLEIFQIFAQEFSKRDKKDYVALSKCYFTLNQPQVHADIIIELFNSNIELCYQLLSDIQDIGSILYCQILASILKSKLPQDYSNLEFILLGKFKEKIQKQFLAQNNNVDKILIKNLASKWRPKDSMSTVGTTLSMSLSLLGSQDINLLKDYTKQFGSIKNWSLFSTAGSLGLIFNGKQNFIGEARELTLNENSQFLKGGLLYAEGLSNFGTGGDNELKQELLNKIKLNDEALVHGAIISLGLRFAFSNDPDLIFELKKFILDEKANQGEAAGYALGLIKASHWDSELIEELVNTCRNNPHDRIARATMGSIGLMALNSQADILPLFRQLIADKDYLVRFGAISLLSIRYFASGNNQAVKELLEIAGTDLSNDVRRLAVLGIAFVMLKKKNKVFTLLKMLSTSYNAYIRHAVALGLGIVFAHSFDKKVLNLLRRLLEDKTDYVRQAASISMGLVYQLGNEHMDSNFESTRKIINDKFEKKFESGIAKLGYALGLSLMQSGGGNCILNLRGNESWNSNSLKPQTVIGIFMFTFYWYWFPLVNFIGLALEPTFLVGVNKDLKVPRSFQFNSKAPKKLFDYFKISENTEDKQKEAAPVVLSITRRAKARLEKPEAAKNKTDAAKEGMNIEEAGKNDETDKKDDKKTVLMNCNRVLKKQINYIDFNTENKRYEPVFDNRKIGIIFLKDSKEGEPEEFADDQPNKPWLIPPPEFKFVPEENK